MLDHANVLMSEDISEELFLSFHYVTAKNPSWSTDLEALMASCWPLRTQILHGCVNATLCRKHSIKALLGHYYLNHDLFCFLFLILFLP